MNASIERFTKSEHDCMRDAVVVMRDALAACIPDGPKSDEQRARVLSALLLATGYQYQSIEAAA